jgi:hypothetical protein
MMGEEPKLHGQTSDVRALRGLYRRTVSILHDVVIIAEFIGIVGAVCAWIAVHKNLLPQYLPVVVPTWLLALLMSLTVFGSVLFVLFQKRAAGRAFTIATVVVVFFCLPFIFQPPKSNSAASRYLDYPDTIQICSLPDVTKYDAAMWSHFSKHLDANLGLYRVSGYIPKAKAIKTDFDTNFTSATRQLAELRGGTNFQIFCLAAGATATAVLDSNYHYLPQFVLCGTNGRPATYHAKYIVGPRAFNSKDLVQLAKDATLTLGVGDSNSLSSFMIMRLSTNALKARWTSVPCGAQNDLIDGIVKENFDIAVIADDALARYLAMYPENADKIQERDWPSNLVSAWGNEFPSFTFGWRNDLPIPLQLCIAKTFNEHDWLGDTNFMSHFKRGFPEAGIVVPLTNCYNLWSNAISIKRELDNAMKN